MPIDDELIALLACPETKQPLQRASAAQLARVNELVRAGNAYDRAGTRLAKELSEALVRQDGRVLYPVEDGIPDMLVEDSIAL